MGWGAFNISRREFLEMEGIISIHSQRARLKLRLKQGKSKM